LLVIRVSDGVGVWEGITSGFFEVLEEANFAGLEEDQAFSFATDTSRCPSDAMNVVPRIVRRVYLQDPIYGRDIETTSSHVCADQCAV
jgi:hypothetical protein